MTISMISCLHFCSADAQNSNDSEKDCVETTDSLKNNNIDKKISEGDEKLPLRKSNRRRTIGMHSKIIDFYFFPYKK